MANKQNRTGRSNGGSDKEYFTPMPRPMMESYAFKSLNGNAVKLVLDISNHYWGKTTGPISYSLRQAYTELGLSKDTARKCLAELVDKGFLTLVKKGDFVRGHGSTYFLSWREHRERRATPAEIKGHRDDAPVVVPSNAWREWKPPQEPAPKPRKLYGSTKRNMPAPPTVPADMVLN